jgi:mRNA-degrading endonuclease RelE of RelBE toxin-antitoxin system
MTTTLRMSKQFSKMMDDLSPNVKKKLPRIFELLKENTAHPSLQMKKSRKQNLRIFMNAEWIKLVGW